jgi:hypothetical protein
MYDIYFDLNSMHRVVEEEDSANQLSLLYNELAAISTDEDFDLELDLPLELGDDDYAVLVREPCVCFKCGEIYPYADPNQKDGSFKCYSCRKWG